MSDQPHATGIATENPTEAMPRPAWCSWTTGSISSKKGQQTKGIEVKNFQPTYRALEDYDVNKLYVEKESLEARGLTEDDLVVPAEVMSKADIGKLMESQDVVMSF